jgi:hypothetical protein
LTTPAYCKYKIEIEINRNSDRKQKMHSKSAEGSVRLATPVLPWLLVGCLFASFPSFVAAQGSYRAQLRGAVSDATGAVVRDATVTITETGTNISSGAHTDDKGGYYFTGLRPSTYSVRVQAPGFRIAERTSVVLAVDQEATLNFTLTPAGVSEKVEVTMAAPLLDTESSTLGTDVTNEYVKDLPLLNRSFFGLAFLSGGVTEVAGAGTQDNYPAGTNFVSNGQRNATADVRIDGALISAPEQGEGATSNVYYEPSVEIIQEFKVQNNSFSSEFGNNGGTVVNMVLRSGTNAFHGSSWWFAQRAGTDARDFFNPKSNGPKPNHERDQYGFALGGPIRKNRTFFFFDFERVRDNEPINLVATVPTNGMFGTSNERAGDFSGAANPIFDPVSCSPDCSTRTQVQSGGVLNVIPASEIDKIGQAIINQYPQPNLPGEFNNYRQTALSHGPDYQFDIKLDHQISDKHRVNGRYSRLHSNFVTPPDLGDGSDNTGDNGGIGNAPLTVQNGSLEYTWTLNPRIIWTSHFAVDRAVQPQTTSIPSLTTAGLPTVLEANGLDRMPTIQMSGNSPWSSLYDQCCINTTFAHTLYSYSSQLVIAKGSHLMKIGGEQRIFFNNFFQPPNPTGLFNFTDDVTSQVPNTNAGGGSQGNPFASLLFGYPDNNSVINIYPAVANKSKETGFYFQDDWKVNSKLTLNLGLRYEWSTPYTERDNRIQFSDFNGSSGMSIDLTSGGKTQALGLGTVALNGTTLFPTSGMRNVPVDRNNFGPRLGFAYQLNSNTVVRGGAGIYYGMSVATNFQYPGTAFRKSATMFFTLDNFNDRSATLANPFPGGLTGPQGKQYGSLAEWGYANGNDLGTTAGQNADIYQWNLGIQRLLPSQIVIGVDYSANRSTHLPWGGSPSTRNRDFISSSLLAQISAQQHAADVNGAADCDANGCVSNYLANTVANPFCAMFGGTGCPTAGTAIFNEPDSRYNQPVLPLGNLLRSFPQFDGDFEGLPLLEASSWYNSMQIRFQKRTTHHVSFEGSYTVAKLTDDSSVGANSFVGTLNNGNPQQLDNLKAEHSISANDTPQRLAAAIIVELPIGRKQWIGGNMNRIADAVVGGWNISTLITEQSGQPLSIPVANGGRLMDGSQRPNVLCGGGMGISNDQAAINQTPVINVNCFADPGDQVPGNGPRYYSGLRTNGIHNVDMSLYKEFTPRESMKLQLRADIFNGANHPRFAPPNTAFNPGDQTFGIISSTAAGYTPRRMQFGIRFEF